MNIYTKGGDKGQTSLIGGKRVPKYSLQVEAYGTVDELKSYTGLIYDLFDDKLTKESLLKIINQLFVAESLMSIDKPECGEFENVVINNLPHIDTNIFIKHVVALKHATCRKACLQIRDMPQQPDIAPSSLKIPTPMVEHSTTK